MSKTVSELEKELEEAKREIEALRRENAELKAKLEVGICVTEEPTVDFESESTLDLINRRAEISFNLKKMADALLNHRCHNEVETITEVLKIWKLYDDLAKPMPTKRLNELILSQELSVECVDVIYNDIEDAVRTAPMETGRGRRIDWKYADLIKKLVLNQKLSFEKAERLLEIYCGQFCKKTADGIQISNAEGLFKVAMKSEKFTVGSVNAKRFYVRMT